MGLFLGLSESATRSHIMFGYERFDPYTVKVMYKNKVTGAYREYIVLSDLEVTDKQLLEARRIADKLYGDLRDNAPVPNIPLYGLLYVLIRNTRGITYRCKVRRENCPLKILRIERGVMVSMSVQSLIEQLYRVVKKYGVSLPQLQTP